jgi:hypothetical protein
VQVTDGLFDLDVPTGTYGVIATLSHFYAFYTSQFEVLPGQENILQAILSPVLNPGMLRAVLSWGPMPKDLDSYIFASSNDGRTLSCLVNYKKKKCPR